LNEVVVPCEDATYQDGDEEPNDKAKRDKASIKEMTKGDKSIRLVAQDVGSHASGGRGILSKSY
jgi:hypothetical protein